MMGFGLNPSFLHNRKYIEESDKMYSMDKINNTSVNTGIENLDKLRRVFPNFVKENKIDFDALKKFFQNEEIVTGEEKYGLNWAGKSNAFKLIRTPSVGTLTPQEKESKDWDKTENLFIEGDNLEVLKLLQKHYREKIKMIYIDPPYNTGKDFIYKDNYTENISDYYEKTGQSKNGIKMTTNPESAGRYHSDWLTMMYPRLFLARNLLKEDGVIFISIDDNEVANLRLIMDEIFGEENFVANIVWERAYSPVNLKRHFSENHDFILCFSKNIELLSNISLKRTKEADERYQNLDNDNRGPWKSSDFSVGPINKNNLYEIITPLGRKVLPPKGRSWVVSEKRYQEMLKDNRIWFGKNNDNVPAQKRFLSEVQAGITPTTIWLYKDVGHTQDARKELKELFDGNAYFDYPKPVSLMHRIIELVTQDNDIILDFFAGSGTTAHAVMELNAADGGNRKWICIQLPEETNEDSEAYKAGYKNIAEIAKERIRRAGKKITKGDTGFKSLSLSKSNYRQWNLLTDKDDEQKLKKQMKLFLEKPLVDNYDEKSVIYEILIKEGYDLNATVSAVVIPAEAGIQDFQIWKVEDDNKKLLVTFEKKITKDQVESIKLTEEDTFVCLDSALDDTTKINIGRNLNVKVI